MGAALRLSGVKMFIPKSNSSSFFYQLTPIQFMLKSKSSFCYPSIHFRRQQHHLVVFQPPRLSGHSSCCYQPIHIRPKLSGLRLRCEAGKVDELQSQNLNEFDCVIKFGVDSADKMREAAEFIRNFDRLIRSFESFEEKRPVVLLSAMGETNNKLQLAVEKAASGEVSDVSDLEELTFIEDLHLRTADELGINRQMLSHHLFKLEQLLKATTIKDMNLRLKDYVVSYGERLSAWIFAAYLNKIGVNAREYVKPPKECHNLGAIMQSSDGYTSIPAPMQNGLDRSPRKVVLMPNVDRSPRKVVLMPNGLDQSPRNWVPMPNGLDRSPRNWVPMPNRFNEYTRRHPKAPGNSRAKEGDDPGQLEITYPSPPNP